MCYSRADDFRFSLTVARRIVYPKERKRKRKQRMEKEGRRRNAGNAGGETHSLFGVSRVIG